MLTAQVAAPVEVTQVEAVVVGAVPMAPTVAEPAGAAVRLTLLVVVAVRERTLLQAITVVVRVAQERVLATRGLLDRAQLAEEEEAPSVIPVVGLVQVAAEAVGFMVHPLWERSSLGLVAEAEAAMTVPPGLALGLTVVMAAASSSS